MELKMSVLRVLFVHCCCLLLDKAISTCQDPFSGSRVEVNETDPADTLVLNLGPSTDTIWSLSVSEPGAISTELFSYFSVTSDPVTPTWLVTLKKELDLEQIYADYGVVLDIITLDLTCTETGGKMVPYSGVVVVLPVSEFPPVFLPEALTLEVAEDTVPLSTVADLQTLVSDDDINTRVSDIDTFQSTPVSGQARDGVEMFEVTSDGKIRLLQELDHEEGERSFYLNVTVTDDGGLTSEAVLRIDVRNVNDNAPIFDFSGGSSTEYRATIDPGYTGPLTGTSPNDIQATDPDGDTITYSITSGSPANYSAYLSIDNITGSVDIITTVRDFDISHFSLVIQAIDSVNLSDATASRHMTTAILFILISGREAGFPAVIDGTSEGDRDDFHISTITLACLSGLLLLILILLIVICLCRRRLRNKQNKLSREPSEPRKAVMRSVHSGSEKRFIRELSATTGVDWTMGRDNLSFHESNCGTRRGSELQPGIGDVFVTDMDSWVTIQNGLSSFSRPALTATPQLIAFDDAIDAGVDNISPAKNSPSNGETRRYSLPNTSDNTHAKQLLDARDLESQYRAIDLLTSVTPLDDAEVMSLSPVHHQLRQVTPASSSAGTVRSIRSLRDTDVIEELEDIMAQQRSPSRAPDYTHNTPPVLPNGFHGFLTDNLDSSYESGLTPFNSVAPLSEERSSTFIGHENTTPLGPADIHADGKTDFGNNKINTTDARNANISVADRKAQFTIKL